MFGQAIRGIGEVFEWYLDGCDHWISGLGFHVHGLVCISLKGQLKMNFNAGLRQGWDKSLDMS